jgi:hypothetical protein
MNSPPILTIVPKCQQSTIKGDAKPPEIQIRCTAYNGEIGFAVSYVGDPNLKAKARAAERYACQNTSRRIAKSVDMAL